MTIDGASDTLARQFLVRSRQDIGRLNDLLHRAVNGEWMLLEESSRTCHSIHGAAAMFGYPKLSRAAAALQCVVEDMLRDWATSPSRQSGATIVLIESADKLTLALTEASAARPAEACMFKQPLA